jgi:hypothetical protein
MDEHRELDPLSRGGQVQPVGPVGSRHTRLLMDALRADDDVLEREVDVGKGREKLRIEVGGARVAVPLVVPGLHLVHAIVRQRGHEAGEVARVLGDRVPLPQLADLDVFGRIHITFELLADLRIWLHDGSRVKRRGAAKLVNLPIGANGDKRSSEAARAASRGRRRHRAGVAHLSLLARLRGDPTPPSSLFAARGFAG